MINSNMKKYDYYLLPEKNEYGQQLIVEGAPPDGVIELAIHETNKNINDNNLYSGAQYVGLTFSYIDDTYIIQYGDRRLKVLYTIASPRYTQVFLVRM